MATKKPVPSEELKYLRLVMEQEFADDDVNDVVLSRYRDRMNRKPEWVMQQKRITEENYRAEIAAWKKENQEQPKAEKEDVVEEIPEDPCEVLVERMLNEWDRFKVGEVDIDGKVKVK